MATILTSAIISQATSSVEEYASQAKSIASEIQSIITALASNFEGDAADGYKEFFTQKVSPAINENLEGLTNSIKQILESIQTQLLATVDPQLGDNNRNPGA
jgi:uncharacterized protein YukE